MVALIRVDWSYSSFQVGNISGRLTQEYFRQHRSCARSAAFINLREVIISELFPFNNLSRNAVHNLIYIPKSLDFDHFCAFNLSFLVAFQVRNFVVFLQVTGRFRFPPGNYVIVPSTFEPNEEAEFMLRIYTNGFIKSE